jgi:hypothetical protein
MVTSKAVPGGLEKLRTENERLKAENGKLKKVVATTHGAKNTSHLKPMQIFRKLSIFLLGVAAIALLTTGNLLFWFGNTIVKPDRFTAATGPIIKDPKVQQTIASYTTNNLFQAVDVQKITEEVLPPKADFLAPQLSTQLKSATEKTLQNTLAKPAFQEKWNTVLANQHERFINFAAKYTGNGTISLNDVYNQLSGSLQNTKLAFLSNKKLPARVGSVAVVNASWLPALHNVVTNIDTWRTLSLLAFVLCVALAIWLSQNKRKTLYIISVAASSFMLISLVAVRVARETIAQKADPQYSEGVRSALQIFFHPLVLQTATIFFTFILVGFIAWVSSPSHSAAALRNKVGFLFSGKLHDRMFGEGTNKYLYWVSSNKHILEWGAVALIALLMLLVRLTLKSLFLYGLLMLISILAIEVIAGQPTIKTYKLKEP